MYDAQRVQARARDTAMPIVRARASEEVLTIKGRRRIQHGVLISGGIRGGDLYQMRSLRDMPIRCDWHVSTIEGEMGAGPMYRTKRRSRSTPFQYAVSVILMVILPVPHKHCVSLPLL